MALGNCFTVLINERGDVYSFGQNTFGKLGIGTGTGEQLLPCKVNFSTRLFSFPAMVSAGWQHAACVMNDGTVYAWGDNTCGRLGIPETPQTANSWSPMRMPPLLNNKKAMMVACGDSFTLLLTQDNCVFSCGWTGDGQLGFGDDSNNKLVMTQINQRHFSGEKVSALAAGHGHCIAVGGANNDMLWTWGENGYGQLACNNRLGKKVPTKIEPWLMQDEEDGEDDESPIETSTNTWTGGPVACIHAGGYCTAILAVSGTLYTCGQGIAGTLGLGDIMNRKRLTHVGQQGCFGGQTVRAAAIGFNHMIAVTHQNVVYSWGSGAFGELGQSTLSCHLIPTVVNAIWPTDATINIVAAGRLHQCVVTDTGVLYGWGTWRNKNHRFLLNVKDRTPHQEQQAAMTSNEHVGIARVGLWHKPRQNFLAVFEQGLHTRDGNDSPVQVLNPDSWQCIAGNLTYEPHKSCSNALLTLMGFPQRAVVVMASAVGNSSHDDSDDADDSDAVEREHADEQTPADEAAVRELIQEIRSFFVTFHHAHYTGDFERWYEQNIASYLQTLVQTIQNPGSQTD